MTTEAVHKTPIHTTEAPKAKDSAVEKKDSKNIEKNISDKNRQKNPANDAEVDAYLAEKGFTPDHKKIEDLSKTKEKAKEEANKEIKKLEKKLADKDVDITDPKDANSDKKQDSINQEMKEWGYPIESPKEKETRLKKNIEADIKANTPKKPESKKESKPRRTEADENARPGSKPYVKPPKKEKTEVTPKEKKKGKFWSNTGKALKRTAKAPRRLVKSAAKTARTPVGLSSYLLADIGVKDKTKRNGWKDRWAGYKKIRSDKK